MWCIYSENSSAHCASLLNEIAGEMSDTKAEGGKERQNAGLPSRHATQQQHASLTRPHLLYSSPTTPFSSARVDVVSQVVLHCPADRVCVLTSVFVEREMQGERRMLG